MTDDGVENVCECEMCGQLLGLAAEDPPCRCNVCLMRFCPDHMPRHDCSGPPDDGVDPYAVTARRPGYREITIMDKKDLVRFRYDAGDGVRVIAVRLSQGEGVHVEHLGMDDLRIQPRNSKEVIVYAH